MEVPHSATSNHSRMTSNHSSNFSSVSGRRSSSIARTSLDGEKSIGYESIVFFLARFGLESGREWPEFRSEWFPQTHEVHAYSSPSFRRNSFRIFPVI